MEHLVPVAAIAGYLYYPKDLRIPSTILHSVSILHNLGLLLFSGYTCIALSQILYEAGIVFQSNYYFQNPAVDRIIFYFYISKYYELIDTFLLYLNGKTPIFLQKYHHIGAILSWHIGYYARGDLTLFASLMNSFIHTIMYSYYLCCLLQLNQVRMFKQWITNLQFCQFFLGLGMLYTYFPPVETPFNYCVLIICQLYNVGLIILFGNFYIKQYIATPSSTQKTPILLSSP